MNSCWLPKHAKCVNSSWVPVILFCHNCLFVGNGSPFPKSLDIVLMLSVAGSAGSHFFIGNYWVECCLHWFNSSWSPEKHDVQKISSLIGKICFWLLWKPVDRDGWQGFNGGVRFSVLNMTGDLIDPIYLSNLSTVPHIICFWIIVNLRHAPNVSCT